MTFISGFLCQKLDYPLEFDTLRAMSGIERQGGEAEHKVDPVNILALYESGRIREQEMSDEESVNLHRAKAIMLDDPVFEAKVRQRQHELEEESKARQIDPQIIEKSNAIEITAHINLGRIKTSDLSEENKKRIEALRKEAGENPELKARIIKREKELTPVPNLKVKKRRAGTKTPKQSKPPEKAALNTNRLPKGMQLELVFDDSYDQKVMKVGKMLNGRLGGYKDKALRKEVRTMKNRLRNEIGLPIARRGSGHEKNKFYKFLVRRIVTWDMLHIFGEYVSVAGESSEDLNIGIAEVKNLVDELLNGDLNMSEKYFAFDAFVEKHGYEHFNF